MMTDPIADMLTRIRNANRIERQVVDMPASKFKLAIAQVLKDEGFVLDYQVGVPGTDEAGAAAFHEEKDLGKRINLQDCSGPILFDRHAYLGMDVAAFWASIQGRTTSQLASVAVFVSLRQNRCTSLLPRRKRSASQSDTVRS